LKKNSRGGLFSSKATKKKAGNTEEVTGYFKGVVQIESMEAKQAYQQEKAEIISELQANINQLSQKVLGKPMTVDVEKLGSAQERLKFETNVRSLGIDHLNISKHLCNLESDEILKRSLLLVTKQIIRVYMVEAFDLSSRDNGSASDSYLQLRCNDTHFSERDDYQLDEANPVFYKKYDFEGLFPGTSPLSIEAWDYDAIFGDELIGKTIVDLEDRYFSLEWQSLAEKPIEYRQVYHPSSSLSKGVLKCWIEIVDAADSSRGKDWDIAKKPVEYFEVRICVLNCQDIQLDASGTVDAYFRGFFDSKEDTQETDTHFRCQDGKPDFQYRLVYKVGVPRKDYKFSLQCYDRDFFKSNEMLGEATIQLKQLIEDCALVKKPLGLNKTYYQDVLKKFDPDLELKFDKADSSKFWLRMMAKNPKTGKIESNGEVKMQVDVLPYGTAEKNPVGKARDNPNHSPQLPQPQGRLELSFNPIKMFNQLVGPALRRKLYCYCCLLVLVALVVMMLPQILSGLIVACI